MRPFEEDALTSLHAQARNRRGSNHLLPWTFVAALAIVVIGLVGYRLERAPVVSFRSVRLRLSGVRWEPYRSLAAPGRFTAMAVKRGVGELLNGEPRRALAILSKESQGSDTPSVWNDVAVASYEVADRHDAPEIFVDALAATDHALALDPQMSEALFNRAAILQRLGLRDDARAAWERLLTSESDPGWQAEARQQLRLLQPEPSFLETLDRDPRRIGELAAHDPQGARLTGSIDLLARWATKRDAHSLDLTRSLGAAVAARNGDRSLEEGVRAIDIADAPARDALAEAHRLYAEAFEKWRNNRPGEAETWHTRAAEAFARGRSPLVWAARENAARMMYEQGRDADAIREEEAVVHNAPASFAAIRAHAQWMLGVIETSAGQWGDALPLLQRAAAGFERLGEVDHLSRVERVIAFVYDRTGDDANAWKHRMIALRGVGKTSSLALEKTVSTIALAQMAARKWRVAESLLVLEVEIARRIHDDVQLTDALLYRAAVRHELGDEGGAGRDLSDAEGFMARLADDGYRAYFRADALAIHASLEADAGKASAYLTTAIDYVREKGDRMELPTLFLQRARVLRRGGDLQAAATDLERGISAIEASRQSLPAGQARWGAFYAHEELFEDAIDLAANRDDAAAAFRFAERARARALLDTYGRTPAFDAAPLPDDTILVELVSLPQRLLLITPSRVVKIDVTREELRAEIDALMSALRTNALQPARTAGAKLYQRLVAAIDSDEKTIVFAPDSTTSIVPFAALIDGQNHYLVERHTIVVAPSAAVFSAAHQDPRPLRSVLIVSNNASGEPLTNVDAESRRVASAYRSAREIHDAASLRRDHTADAIHFAGHAIGDESGLEPASILLADERMSAAEIAKLRLSHTSVVVLAACSTARGERRSTEGAISVAYGFLSAGARSVVATLWPIEDTAAANFFPRLHREMAAGRSPADALRNVQLDMIRDGGVPPSLWASLQDIGS